MASAGALGMLSGCGETPQQQAEARPPNIIYIMLDDLGYADFGCYGSEHLQTTHVDHFRTESMKFTDCYAGAAVCAPCRSVLMTGYHTGHGFGPGECRHGARSWPRTSPWRSCSRKPVTGPACSESGDSGDAHSTGVPNRHGFDESFGYLHQIHAHDYYTDFLWKNGEKYPLPGNAGGKREQYSADIIFEESLNFLRDSKDQPFFLYGAYTLPHGKWEIPSDAPYTGKDWPQVAKNYAAMVTKADDQIGPPARRTQDTGTGRKHDRLRHQRQRRHAAGERVLQLQQAAPRLQRFHLRRRPARSHAGALAGQDRSGQREQRALVLLRLHADGVRSRRRPGSGGHRWRPPCCLR